MLSFSLLSDTEAIPLWNNFTSSLSFPVPFSFNPSLFYFYRKHFHWKPYYFLLSDDDVIRGVLPLVNTGKAWVSLPHFSYGGVLTDDSSLVRSKIIGQIIAEILFQQLSPGFYKSEVNRLTAGLPDHQKIFIRSLGEQNDSSFQKSEKVTGLFYLKNGKRETFHHLSSNLRRKIRKASENGLIFKNGGTELLHDFYSVYSENIRHLRSVNYGKGYFHDFIQSYLYGQARFFVAYLAGKPVGSALTVSYHGFIENVYFATLPRYRQFYVSDALHWQMCRFFIGLGKADERPLIYSLGRSTENSSVQNYKNHWPIKKVPLYVFSNFDLLHQKAFLGKLWKVTPQRIKVFFGPRVIDHLY